LHTTIVYHIIYIASYLYVYRCLVCISALDCVYHVKLIVIYVFGYMEKALLL